MAEYLVTGGAGFIGSNIVEVLLNRGESVRVLDNFSTGKRENLSAFKDRIELVEGDICDLDACRDAVRGVRYVLHQAALASVPRSVKMPIESNRVNVEGTLNVLVAARDESVKRVVYAGSSSAYGDTPTLPKEESMKPEPLSPYAISKLTGEYYCQVFYPLYGLETVVLRYFNVFGPRQDPESQYAAVIPKFLAALMNGESPTIYGDGEQSRDFTFVENVVEANLLATMAEGAAGKVFNLACGERITVNQLAEAIKRELGSGIDFTYAASRPGDVKHSLADITRARSTLGFEPKVTTAEGLRRTVAWYVAQAGQGGTE